MTYKKLNDLLEKKKEISADESRGKIKFFSPKAEGIDGSNLRKTHGYEYKLYEKKCQCSEDYTMCFCDFK